jgi:hypothetical protein
MKSVKTFKIWSWKYIDYDGTDTFGIQVHKWPSPLPEYLQIFKFHFYFKINEKHNIPHCWNSSLIQSKNIRNRIKLITRSSNNQYSFSLHWKLLRSCYHRLHVRFDSIPLCVWIHKFKQLAINSAIMTIYFYLIFILYENKICG